MENELKREEEELRGWRGGEDPGALREDQGSVLTLLRGDPEEASVNTKFRALDSLKGDGA